MCSKVKDFLTDNDSIDYAPGVTPGTASQWKTYFRRHPERMTDAEEVRTVLLASADVACDFSLIENQDPKDRVVNSIKDFSNTLQLDQIEVGSIKASREVDTVFHRYLSDQVL